MHPQFCPRISCVNHFPGSARGKWFRSAGSYETIAFGTVPRFVCVVCGKYFSTQTFSLDYYSKRTISYRRLFDHVKTTSSVRDMARDFGVSVDVVTNKLSRLGRNGLSVLQRLRNEIILNEDLVADGFESFTVSQYFPCHINLVAGKESQMVYRFDYVTVRRKGRMTKLQKTRRETLEKRFRVDKKGIETSFRMIFDDNAELVCGGRRVAAKFYTDRHLAYARARLKSLSFRGLSLQERLSHIRIDSRLPRTILNPLFAVNYLDRQFRKDLAEHVRETVCFGRNVSNAIDRCITYLVYHNTEKAFRESQGDMRTHAEVAGISSDVIRQIRHGFFSKRAISTHIQLDDWYRGMWTRGYRTPLKRKNEYLPKYAAA